MMSKHRNVRNWNGDVILYGCVIYVWFRYYLYILYKASTGILGTKQKEYITDYISVIGNSYNITVSILCGRYVIFIWE